MLLKRLNIRISGLSELPWYKILRISTRFMFRIKFSLFKFILARYLSDERVGMDNGLTNYKVRKGINRDTMSE